eukprot:TRINITY_DN9853_c0_g2_i3.p1 TRINITY_DN9853_c0_g2~~TRINITY_DN9853_c0_g2_i3.p1  ORF type:complete len:478 (-),score=79.96 TRINITY_DN9853_c0_g2_i3:181-1614(-)
MGCCASVREPRKERDRFEGMAEFDKSAELGLSPGQSGSHVEVVAPDADKPELLTQEELERAENKRREAAAADKAQEMERRKMARRAEEKMFSDAAEAASSPGVQLTKVFGCTVAEASARSGGGVPSPIWESIRWLSGHGLKTEGLFRIPGRTKQVTFWRDRFNVDPFLVLPADESPANVSSIIVSWLRHLKDERGNRGFIYCARDPDRGETVNLAKHLQQHRRRTGRAADVPLVRSLLLQLPVTERGIFYCITGLLHYACMPQNARLNQMTAYNFAMCTFPEIMAAVQVMITNHALVFESVYPPAKHQEIDGSDWSVATSLPDISISDPSNLMPEVHDPRFLARCKSPTPWDQHRRTATWDQLPGVSPTPHPNPDPFPRPGRLPPLVASDDRSKMARCMSAPPAPPNRAGGQSMRRGHGAELDPGVRKCQVHSAPTEARGSELANRTTFSGLCKHCHRPFKTPLLLRTHTKSCEFRT